MPDTADITQDLMDVVSHYGAMNSNPVLDILGNHAPRMNSKYPQEELRFDEGLWRAFYHCHDYPEKDSREHGHFHIFARCGKGDDINQDWCHLIGLSMDFEGQVLSWFTVNQWVSGGKWLPARELKPLLKNTHMSKNWSIAERWLVAMINAYRQTIEMLIDQRDKHLTQVNSGHTGIDMLENRDIYELSKRVTDLRIHLKHLLKT